MKHKIDFLCVGFQKSGTTTLDAILRQHSQIELPIVKETQYFYWQHKYDNSKCVFFERFFEGEDQKIRGAVEPEFDFYAKEIRQTFGKDIKLIFIMRNPVERLYSCFKMELRQGAKWIRSIYDKYIGTAQMFDQFVTEYIVETKEKINPYVDRGNYMICIKEFLRFFPKENMKFIIFEDYIQDPEKTIGEIQSFLGVDYEELNCNITENIGNQISRNYGCLLMNGILTKMDFSARCNKHIPVKIYEKVNCLNGNMRNIFSIDNKEKMNRRTRRICEDFYRNDKQELEAFLQRDLSKVWFR